MAVAVDRLLSNVQRPLIVITGPTASGKSGLALELAERYSGEIICADSRTVYRGMDIGTAKPSSEDRARVPHHLLDVAEPGERFTVHDFQRLARQAIDDIRKRGRIPFLVGGTGLYIDSVVLNYNFVKNTSTPGRDKLEAMTTGELQVMIKNQQLQMPDNSQNRRHLVGVIERANEAHTASAEPDENTYVVAISTDRNKLEDRIRLRAADMFESGVVDEARDLGEKYGWSCEAMSGNIYPILKEVIDGTLTETQAIEKFVIRDRQLAKRQITWLKRHDFVRWLGIDEARAYLEGRIGSLTIGQGDQSLVTDY